MMVESIILPRIGEKSRFCFVMCSLIRTSEQCSRSASRRVTLATIGTQEGTSVRQ